MAQPDWNTIFAHLNLIRDELKENFPYKVVDVYGCEADDIIAVLCQDALCEEKILIISSDKDFQQLQILKAGVKQQPQPKSLVNYVGFCQT